METAKTIKVDITKRDEMDLIMGHEWDIVKFYDDRFNYITGLRLTFKKKAQTLSFRIKYALGKRSYSIDYRKYLPNYVNN